MNKSLLIFAFTFGLIVNMVAQGPSFKYQGVARNAQNAALVNQNISLRLSIVNAANATVYSEIHNTRTSDLGIFNVNVCGGSNPSGTCAAIDWSVSGYQLKVELDPAGGSSYLNMGNSPILSVPVAAYASKAGSVTGVNDGNPQNELQTLSFNSNSNMLSISQGNNVDLTALKNDADFDPTNEIQTISLDTTNNEIRLSKNGGSFLLPSSGNSLWTKAGSELKYSHSSSVGITFNPGKFELSFGPTSKKNFTSSTNKWAEEYTTFPTNAMKTTAYGAEIQEYPATFSQYYLRFNADTFFQVRATNFTSPGVSTQLVLSNAVLSGTTPVRVIGTLLDAQGGIGRAITALAGRPGCGLVAATINNTVTPYMGVFSPSNPNSLIGGIYINGTQSIVAANMKNFWMDHPTDPTKEIWYACVEGPEAAAYERGTAQLINGECEVKFSEHFEIVINPTTMTVQLTPQSSESEGLAVVERTATGFKVRELRKGKGTYKFDWEVKGVRKGYEDYKAIRVKGLETPVLVKEGSSIGLDWKVTNQK